MKLGFMVPHMGPRASKEAIDRTCDEAEELGADSLWFVDHIAIPFHFDAKYPYTDSGAWGPSAETPWWDCLGTMAYAAARTKRVQLGTGVLILPYRHPLDTAKRIATIDVLSEGRVLFGVGVGWLEDEFDALQLGTYHQRGAVTDEQLQVMKNAWRDEHVSFKGKHYQFNDVSITPKPAQKPHPPLLIGGNTDAALKRTVRFGQGWHALSLLPAELQAHREKLARFAADAGREGDIPASMLIGMRLTKDPDERGKLSEDVRRNSIVGTPEQVAEDLRAYEAAGLEHLMTVVSGDPSLWGGDPAGGMAFVLREIAPAVRAG